MKAATEEVNKMLENAGQKISFEDNPIYLNRIQLDDMPVLGVFAVLLHVIYCILLTGIVSTHHALTCCILTYLFGKTRTFLANSIFVYNK